ncbi:MAG: hypothetical protein RI892_1684, partial [Pseudomonadota bacterium]
MAHYLKLKQRFTMTSSSTNSSRAHGRNQNQLRPVKITRGYTVHAEGSV